MWEKASVKAAKARRNQKRKFAAELYQKNTKKNSMCQMIPHQEMSDQQH
jgi:hypothetical protein